MHTQLIVNITILMIIPVTIAYAIERKGAKERTRQSYVLWVLGIIVFTMGLSIALNNLIVDPMIKNYLKLGITSIGNLFIFMWGLQRIRHTGLPTYYFWLFIIPFLNLIFVIVLMILPKKNLPSSDFSV